MQTLYPLDHGSSFKSITIIFRCNIYITLYITLWNAILKSQFDIYI